ncbi:MAG: signal peptidase I [Kineosporiaceae bacterium]|nr:signal peptidase I [Aeromicrobium sp.]
MIASIAALVAFGLGPQTGAYRTLTVLSGSMVPAFSPGDVVIATKKAPKEVKVGDVIVFNEPVGNHHVTTHRVVKIYKAGTLPLVQTKGDANNANDAFKLQIQGNELWYVRGHVPYFGNVIHALRMPLMKLLAFGCLGLLALVVLWQVWFSGDEDEVDDREDWDLSQT